MFKLGGQAKRPGYQDGNYQELIKQIQTDLEITPTLLWIQMV